MRDTEVGSGDHCRAEFSLLFQSILLSAAARLIVLCMYMYVYVCVFLFAYFKPWYSVASSKNSAPSSFNVQPWSVVLVRDKAGREDLGTAMLGGNATKVLSAPVTAVFCADLGKWGYNRYRIYN